LLIVTVRISILMLSFEQKEVTVFAVV